MEVLRAEWSSLTQRGQHSHKETAGNLGEKPLPSQQPASCSCPKICEEGAVREGETSWGGAGQEM